MHPQKDGTGPYNPPPIDREHLCKDIVELSVYYFLELRMIELQIGRCPTKPDSFRGLHIFMSLHVILNPHNLMKVPQL